MEGHTTERDLEKARPNRPEKSESAKAVLKGVSLGVWYQTKPALHLIGEESLVPTKRNPGLRKAIKAKGGIAPLARSLGIKPSSVCVWTKTPANRVIEVEKTTGVNRRELRPDLYPPEIQ